MAYKITDKCIACGACAGECPVSCITQGDSIYVIDNEQCISCGECARNLPSRSTDRRVKYVHNKKRLNNSVN